MYNYSKFRRLIAAQLNRMSEHVRVSLEAKLGLCACPLDHAGEACGREW